MVYMMGIVSMVWSIFPIYVMELCIVNPCWLSGSFLFLCMGELLLEMRNFVSAFERDLTLWPNHIPRLPCIGFFTYAHYLSLSHIDHGKIMQ